MEGMQYKDFLNQIIFDKSPINVLALSLWEYGAQIEIKSSVSIFLDLQDRVLEVIMKFLWTLEQLLLLENAALTR